jgi:CRISPR-associated protein Cas6
LAGARLNIAGHDVELGPPTVHPLIPAAMLDARLVVIKLTAGIGSPFDRAAFETRFLAEAHRQLAKHEIVGAIELSGRQRLTVGGRRIIGYSLRVGGLTAESSLKLQIVGLGGKRTMGCGIFRPARIKERARRAA